jgi:3-isopropylmalate/(R)-2-methylmalate dehydratase large subunit
MVMVGGDSHTCTNGAFGAFCVGVGSTDLAAAIYAGELWFKVPETMLFKLKGKIPNGVYAKDIILYIISKIGVDGARYKVMEYQGEVISQLSMESRMTITNMAIEAGAKTGVMPVDEVTIEYVREHSGKEPDRDYQIYDSDPDANYSDVYEIDVSELQPMVALPHLPSNGKFVSEIEGEKIKVDQVYIGSCTNAKIEDLRIAAQILKGRKVARDVRVLIVPATTQIWRQAMNEGLLQIFADAGCAVSVATCGACLGGYMGVLAKGERCLSTTNRNFIGRMGHPESEVYLASPATAAATAITGYITDPREFI